MGYIKFFFILIFFTIIVIFLSKEDFIKSKFNNNFFSIFYNHERVLKKIRLSGLNFESNKNIISVSQLKIGQKIHLINLDQIKNRIDNLSWIKNTDIIMHSDGLIDIKVREHKPFAIYKNLEEYFLITDKGLQFLEINKSEFEKYFIITGENSLYALSSLKEIILLLNQKNKNYWNFSNLSPKDPVVFNLCSQINIKKAVRIDSRRWNIYFAEGFLIKLPSKNTNLVFRKFMNLNFKDVDYSKISYIDLRIPDRITIKEK